MICPHCGYSLDDGVAFCIYCGTRLGKFAVSQQDSDAAAGDDSAPAHVAPDDVAAAEVEASGVGDAAGVTTEPVPETAWNLVGDYPEEPSALEGAEQRVAAVPIAPTPAADRPARLHADDALSQRMGELPEKRERKSRKGLAAFVLGLLLVAGIGVGALYVAPNLIDGQGGGETDVSSSGAEDGEGAGEGDGKDDGESSSSSADSSSSSGEESSGSSESEDKPETKYGSTLANAMNGGGSSENADDDGSGNGGDAGTAYSGDAGGAAAVDSGSGGAAAGGGSYPVFAPASATATSISPTEGSTPHGPDLVLDGVPETAWNTNMNGVGESITLSTGQLSTVHGIRIMGGYNKISYSGTDLYYANSRPCDILIEYEGGSTAYTLGDLKRQWQDIAINPPANTTWIKITIRSVYQGSLYDDCCISDIQVY